VYSGRNFYEVRLPAGLSGVAFAGTSAAVWTAAESAPGRMVRLADRAEADMLQTLIIILVLLWLLGVVSSYTLGGFLHILLVVALVLLVVRLASGRRVV
jgi:hypothetical protein